MTELHSLVIRSHLTKKLFSSPEITIAIEGEEVARRAARGRYRVSCTTRMPCRRVMRALGQRATAAR
jgi:hypothetical protein